MGVLLVTYDLDEPGKDYKDVIKTIKSHDGWARLSESCYAIATSKSPQQVFNQLKPYLDDNDNLYVVTLTKPFAGYGPKDVNDWLENNLPD